MNPDLAEDVGLLLFKIGDNTYGADATQVVRIDQPPDANSGRPGTTPLERPELGALKRGDRVLVFRDREGEGQLRVDAVQGLRQVPVDQLRRVPAAALPAPYAVGFWLDGGNPVLLIDLSESLKGGR